MKKTIFSFAMMLMSVGVMAQQAPQAQQQTAAISDSELGQFAQALQLVQSINQQAQQQMVSAVQEQGLEAKRYSEIQNAQQDPKTDAEASKEEMEQFGAAAQALKKIQMQAQQQMQSTITDNTDLSLNRYQEILAMVQQDMELQGRLKEQMQQK